MGEVENVILECGRYKGARSADAYVAEDRRISAGDFLPAKVMAVM